MTIVIDGKTFKTVASAKRFAGKKKKLVIKVS